MERKSVFGQIPNNPYKEKIQVSVYLLQWFDSILDAQADHIEQLEQENLQLRNRIDKIKSI